MDLWEEGSRGRGISAIEGWQCGEGEGFRPRLHEGRLYVGTMEGGGGTTEGGAGMTEGDDVGERREMGPRIREDKERERMRFPNRPYRGDERPNGSGKMDSRRRWNNGGGGTGEITIARDEGANLLGKGIECRGTVADALVRAASLLSARPDREKARKVE